MSAKANKFLLAWLPVLLWMGVIFVTSHQPQSGLPNFDTWDFLIKKSSHFAAYALLGGLLLRADRRWAASLIIAALYALSDEWHQSFIPGRTPTSFDVLIDVLGAAAGIVIARLFITRTRG